MVHLCIPTAETRYAAFGNHPRKPLDIRECNTERTEQENQINHQTQRDLYPEIERAYRRNQMTHGCSTDDT